MSWSEQLKLVMHWKMPNKLKWVKCCYANRKLLKPIFQKAARDAIQKANEDISTAKADLEEVRLSRILTWLVL